MGTLLQMKNTPAKIGTANAFREWRLIKGFTLTALAAALGKTRSASGNLSKLERGLLGYSGDLIEAIAAIYGITPAQLLQGPGGLPGVPAAPPRDPFTPFTAPAPLENSADQAETGHPANLDEAHLLSCFRRMSATSRRYVYLLCSDLYLLGDSAPDPFAMRGLVNFLPVDNTAGAPDDEKPKSHSVSAS